MRGVVFNGNCELEITTFEDPSPGPDEAVIEVRASGMCGSDLRFYRASPDEALATFGLQSTDDNAIIAGHEPCGVVAELGTDIAQGSMRVGDRVMVHHYAGCGLCDLCRTGWTQMCERGPRIFGANAHGGHADYLKVPARTLVPLPDELSFAAGAAISCGTGTAFGALVRLNLTAQDTIAVFGQGPVGRSAAQLAAAMGAKVIAVDITADRVAQAPSFGATHTIHSGTTDPVQGVYEITQGRGVTRALDCSGAPPARVAAVRATAPWGKVAFVGEGGEVEINVSPDIIRKQLTILGSYTFSIVGQADCARFVAKHAVDVDKLFTDRWSLEQAEHAYREFDKQASGKGLFEPQLI